MIKSKIQYLSLLNRLTHQHGLSEHPAILRRRAQLKEEQLEQLREAARQKKALKRRVTKDEKIPNDEKATDCKQPCCSGAVLEQKGQEIVEPAIKEGQHSKEATE